AQRRRPLRNEIPGSRSIGNEADLLTLRLLGIGEASAARVRANLLLGQIADGEASRGELSRSELIKEIRLILLGVPAFLEKNAAGPRILFAPDVVARRNSAASHRPRSLPEGRELHLAVAGRARNGSLHRQVGGDEGRDDALAELLLEVQDVVRNFERPGGGPGVGEVFGGAAAAGPPGLPGVIPELHREPDDLVSLLLQEQGGDRGIDSSGHSDRDAHGKEVISFQLSVLSSRPRETDY